MSRDKRIVKHVSICQGVLNDRFFIMIHLKSYPLIFFYLSENVRVYHDRQVAVNFFCETKKQTEVGLSTSKWTE